MGWRMNPFSGRSEFHEGVDIPIWVGCPVRAAADGSVAYSGWSNGFGNLVMIDHGNGYKTLYGHNQRLMVKKGQQVFKGQVIAKAGSTGLSTGPHVHYQVEYHDKIVNPVNFLDLNIHSAHYYN
jgi:murein DD-endopeptidase MepM/ murein hydrolase activator NlpD